MTRAAFVGLASLVASATVLVACGRAGGSEPSTFEPRSARPMRAPANASDVAVAFPPSRPAAMAPPPPPPPPAAANATPPVARTQHLGLERVLELEPITAVPPRPPRADGVPTDTRGLGSAGDVVLRVRYEGSAGADTWHAWLVRGARELYLYGGTGSLFDVASVVAIEERGARYYVASMWTPELLRFRAAVVDAASFEMVGSPLLAEPRFTVDFPRGPFVARTYPLVVLGELTHPMLALVEPNELARLYPSLGRRARRLPFHAPADFARRGPADEPRPEGVAPFVHVARLRGRANAPDASLDPVVPL